MPVVNLMKYAFFVTLEGRAAGGFQEREDVGIDGNDGDEFVDARVFRFVHVLMAFIACHEAPAAVPFSGGFRAIAEAYLHLFHSDTLCGNSHSVSWIFLSSMKTAIFILDSFRITPSLYLPQRMTESSLFPGLLSCIYSFYQMKAPSSLISIVFVHDDSIALAAEAFFTIG